jgi:5-methylcytosine-specific restriction enzyme B
MDAVPQRSVGVRGARLHPLPGGEALYKRTLDGLLAWIAGERPTTDALGGYFGQGGGACLALLRATGLGRCRGAAIELTDEGRAYAADPDPERLFEHLNAAYAGLLETLVLADTWGLSGPAQRRRLLAALCERAPDTGKTRERPRRRWLVALGLLSRAGATHAITPLGMQVLGAHAAETAEIRKRIEDLLDEEREADLAFAEAMEGDPVADEPPAEGPAATPAPAHPASAEPLSLTAASLRPHLDHLDLPDALLARIAAALSSGKHLLLAGPPGTGKTEIALGLGAAAAAAGYARGVLTVTASADWTTFETIGGYALDRDGALRFRPGVFLTAVEEDRWLLVDELNRADADRAFGELYTVLAGRGAETPFRLDDGRAVSVGPEEGRTHRVRPSFRVLATLNTWDRAHLFRLSAALLRRFAVVHVGPPDDAGYARILDREASAHAADPPLDPAVRAAMGRLFCASGLLARCPIGPAIALDMTRYARRRDAGGEGLAEAVLVVLIPQLEGLPQGDALAVASILDAELSAVAPASALEEVRARLLDLCPDFEPGRALPLPPRFPRSARG